MNSPPLSASLAAASRAVSAVLAGKTPETVLNALPADLRPAAFDLAYSALRDCGRGDFLLGRLMDRPLKDKATRALLLISLARLERRPVEAHTVVDQTVAATGKPFKGLVNAVLRNFLRRRADLLAEADADPVAHWRHRAWWLDSLRLSYPDVWETIAAAGNAHPPMCLRINRRRAASPDFLSGLAGQLLDLDSFQLDKPLPVERIPGFREGLVSVQDWGAQQAARLLDARAGMRVLDACAAPGGKTAHLLERANLDLTAIELDPARARRIGENLDRLGLQATIQVADAARPQDWWDGRPFDRILADVPCSASGVLRRHPDIKWLRRPQDVVGFVRAQAKILDALWSVLVPGGKMLYCTCSVFEAENAWQMRGFTSRHPDARRWPTGDDASLELQLLPTPTHDGFYYALLEKMP